MSLLAPAIQDDWWTLHFDFKSKWVCPYIIHNITGSNMTNNISWKKIVELSIIPITINEKLNTFIFFGMVGAWKMMNKESRIKLSHLLETLPLAIFQEICLSYPRNQEIFIKCEIVLKPIFLIQDVLLDNISRFLSKNSL